jgi:uncharacterized protein
MTEETIEKVIATFLLSPMVTGIDRVVFFGGEPLLNLQGMEYFIGRMEELFAQKKILRIPRFNIITNGTIYTDRVARLFKKYDMGIVVSLDGPRDLHDSQRFFRGTHKGSFDIVAGNVKKIVKDGLKLNIECTVTKQAVKLGYDYNKLKSFFRQELGVKGVSFVPENMTSPEKMFAFSDFKKKGNMYFESLRELDHDNDIFEVPYRLLTRRPLHTACGLGKTVFHILANGDVYPCQLIAGMEEFKIAHIDDFNDSLFKGNSWITRYETHSTKCDSCWAKPICKFCPAREILESDSFTLTESGCNSRRESLEDLIKKVVKMRQDPEQWQAFTLRLKERTKVIEESMDTIAAIH